MAEELHFIGKDPGAVRHGNFINYYTFNSAKSRLQLLPTDLWKAKEGQNLVCLDIGCNSGDLTQELYKFLSTHLSVGTSSVEISDEKERRADCHILGIDLDPILIARAKEANKYTSNVTYKCVNYMRDREYTIPLYLKQHSKNYFDVIFCFSVTMWIHLNHGDEGLKEFLLNVSMQADMVVIEPQPWKCYKSAVRRMKRSGGSFPEFANLKLRNQMAVDIENIFLNECNFIKIEKETLCTEWGRQLLFFKKATSVE